MPLYDEHGRMVPAGGSAQAVLNQASIPVTRAEVPASQTAVVGVAYVQEGFAPPSGGNGSSAGRATLAETSSSEPVAKSTFSIGATGPVFSAPALPIDELMRHMLAVGDGVSDLFFIVGRPPQVENYGKLMPVAGTEYSTGFESNHVEGLARTVVGGNPRLLEDLRDTGSCDSSYALGDAARFRVNVFRQKGSFAMVLRKLNTKIPTLEDLKLAPVFKRIIQEKTGLVFVTGATGSGKTTTLAAMLNELNEMSPMHIVTLEDPVEYLHPHKQATFCQREMGKDFSTFAMGLRAALRQAPKVILVGEIRDRETMEIALTAAETGHVVYSTLHTISAGQSINRVLGMFTKDEEKQVRERLAETLRWIVSQRLAPKVGGGRVMIPEIMGSNLRSRETIQLGENDIRNYADIIEQARQDGWCTFEQTLTEQFMQGVITEETAMLLSVNKSRMRQKLDAVKKSMGQDDTTTDSLKLFHTDEHLTKVNADIIPEVPMAPKAPPLPLDMRLKK